MDELLKMIETVDPSDTAKLDEIDFEVSLYIEQPKNESHIRKKIVWWCPAKKYTRSRDALKEIRPEGWYFRIDYEGTRNGPFPYAEARNDVVVDVFSSGKQKTEELAELHAIIQAIDYDRSDTPREE